MTLAWWSPVVTFVMMGPDFWTVAPLVPSGPLVGDLVREVFELNRGSPVVGHADRDPDAHRLDFGLPHAREDRAGRTRVLHRPSGPGSHGEVAPLVIDHHPEDAGPAVDVRPDDPSGRNLVAIVDEGALVADEDRHDEVIVSRDMAGTESPRDLDGRLGGISVRILVLELEFLGIEGVLPAAADHSAAVEVEPFEREQDVVAFVESGRVACALVAGGGADCKGGAKEGEPEVAGEHGGLMSLLEVGMHNQGVW